MWCLTIKATHYEIYTLSYDIQCTRAKDILKISSVLPDVFGESARVVASVNRKVKNLSMCPGARHLTLIAPVNLS
uniref:Uncharacterized protein n=1 Tax=Oncorhynchus mykiss TaxID=8022 RepID=A0A8C7Q5M2_ONCMY